MARKPTTKTKTLTDYIWNNRITANALAAKLGISPQFLSELRSGRRTPSLVVAVRIARLCGVPVESWVPASCPKSRPAAQ
jgi:transcriptional regulator with XRE-family HTH domain